ncbi:MAG: DUF2520 domain-containing protein [Lachnospiraceae bacterium]|nr:DUF2520 domain-containing protein [Lachnospiraceae bacterium]
MRIGIIGAGKVGTTLGKYLSERGVPIAGYYSRTVESAAQAAEFTGTKVFEDLETLTEASDTLFITTPDGEIGKVWDCIAGKKLSGKLIYHFSGSLSSRVFSGIENTGAAGASVHPMYAFSDKFTSYLKFHTAYFVAEGQEKALEEFQKLFGAAFGHTILTIKAEDKMKYHAAAALASNAMLALFYESQMLLSECGFSEEESRALFTPLVKNNVEAMLAQGAVPAMTGPVERNDVETVKEHLRAICKEADLEKRFSKEVVSEHTHAIHREGALEERGMESEVSVQKERDLVKEDTDEIYQSYLALSSTLVKMAEKKHPDRDYTALKEILKDIS